MKTTYSMLTFDANHLARKKKDDGDYEQEKETIVNALNEMASHGWRVVGQSISSHQTYHTDASLKTGVGVQTKTRIIYTLELQAP
jgi:hypothetical protein